MTHTEAKDRAAFMTQTTTPPTITPDLSGTRYEYAVRLFEDGGPAALWLNERAEKGYRLVSVTGTGEVGFVYVMERRLHVPTPLPSAAEKQNELLRQFRGETEVTVG